MTSLGDLQQLVMLAVVRLGHEAVSRRIKEELETVAGRRVAVGTVHVTLLRLERQGLISSKAAPREEGKPGRPRLLYSITEEGARKLSEAHSAYERMWAGVHLP